MKFRHFLYLSLFALLFLFYPGDSLYAKIFSEKNNLSDSTKELNFDFKQVPFVKPNSPMPELSAEGILILNLDSFTPVYEKNASSSFLPASTVKIITALTAMDVYKLDDVLVVKRAMEEGQVMGLIKDEKITFESLLYGILVHSGNDAAYVIADNYKDGYDKFIEKMNEKAKQLKMNNTHFKNPAGLDSSDQYATPTDLALASRALLKNKELAKIVSTKSITVNDIDFKYFHPLYNVNKLLGEIPGLGGLKTGYTEDAGENLISFYKHNDYQYLIVVLKSKDRFLDTTNILKWINESIEYYSI
jgi:D-alanyl-D-alanine carboxypeptidase